MRLQRKLKTALDETRLLILGAQVLFGFQFNGAFQELFEELPLASRYLHCAALLLIMSAIGLLIAPSMRHRVVEGGQDTNASLEATTLFAGAALLPLALGLSLDVFITLQRVYGFLAGIASGGFPSARAQLLVRACIDLQKERSDGHERNRKAHAAID